MEEPKQGIMATMGWKPIVDWNDYPQYAGMPVLMTVQNGFGQLSVTPIFAGYGDGKWYAIDPHYWKYPIGAYPQLPEGVRNRNELNPAWKILAWRYMPEPYNPYKIDIRYLIKELDEKVKTERSTIEIKKKLIPLVEEHIIYDDPKSTFYERWKEDWEKRKAEEDGQEE